MEGSTDFFTSSPYYLTTDGLFFVVKDLTKDGRDMTEAEKEMYKSNDFENNMFRTPVTRTRIGPDGKRITYTGYVEKGIKITVKRVNQDEEEKKDDEEMKDEGQSAAAAATSQ